MRSWFAVILCALLLLQPGWAADGKHSGGPATVHHCPHAHAPCDPQNLAAAWDATVHTDCGTCHNTCSIALLGTHALATQMPMSYPRPRPTLAPASHPADLPERPQWAALAPA